LPQTEELRAKLEQAMGLIREVVNGSLEIMLQQPERSKEVTSLWEDFLSEFLSFVKKRGKETRRNLFTAVSFRKIWPK
jgi:hypothetical protein